MSPTRPLNARGLLVATLVVLASGCGTSPDLDCGQGTVEVDGECVVDPTGTDASTTSTGASTTLSPDTPTSDETTDDAGDASSSGGESAALRVFTTSEMFTADFHGIDGADARCQEAAAAAGLEGTFIVWLSTSEVDAIDRVGVGPWDLINGTRVFNDPSDLRDEALVPLTIDEYGAELPDDETRIVRTGTDIDGTRAVSPNCVGGGDEMEWNYEGPGPYGAAYGLPDVLDEWTSSDGAIACDVLARLYCFEVHP